MKVFVLLTDGDFRNFEIEGNSSQDSFKTISTDGKTFIIVFRGIPHALSLGMDSEAR